MEECGLDTFESERPQQGKNGGHPVTAEFRLVTGDGKQARVLLLPGRSENRPVRYWANLRTADDGGRIGSSRRFLRAKDDLEAA